MSKKLDIDFWNKQTEEVFYKFKNKLQEKSQLNDEEINDWLEALYYSVASEYGN